MTTSTTTKSKTTPSTKAAKAAPAEATRPNVRTKPIKWGDPPKPKTGSAGRNPNKGAKALWVARLAPFVKRPGEYGCYGPVTKGTVGNLSCGFAAGINPSEWTFTQRVIDGQHIMWARYDGPQA